MKRIFIVLALGFIAFSCNTGYDGPKNTLETLPLTSVVMQTQFAKDSITEIPMNYVLPTVCHSFYDFYYLKDGLTRTVAIISLKNNEGTSCPPSQTTRTIPLKFKPAALGTYHFKFWTGTVAGVDQYLEYDAVVNH